MKYGICILNQIQKMSEILYHDAQVTIYKELLIIKKYYFPLATSKTIMISDIDRVTLHSSEGVEHRWGVCGKYLNNWFPYDGNRKAKTKFIEIILKGKKTRPSITPDDPEKAWKAIWENFTPEGKAYVEHSSQADDSATIKAAGEMKEEEGVMETTEQHLAKPIQVENIDEWFDSMHDKTMINSVHGGIGIWVYGVYLNTSLSRLSQTH